MELETMRPNPAWDPAAYDDAVATFERLADEIEVRVWGGDWCKDCRAQLPDFGAALDAAGIPDERVHHHPVEKRDDGSKAGELVEEYGDALRAFDVDPFEVCAYVLGYSLAYERGEPWQYGVGAQLLHSPIDVDRLDYITRDNEMTGAGVLSFDVERMVDAYTAHPEEGLALSEKALSTIGNYLEGRIALYMWVTQHHKSVYANRLLQAMLGEYAAETGESPVTVDGILDRELDDNAVLERLHVAAREHPDSTLASMYDRFRGRRFPATCWKHRIALADRIGSDVAGDRDGDEGRAPALDEFTAWLTESDDRLERLLADALDVPVHEVWIDRSYVPAYDPDELEDIPIAYGGTTRSVGDWGLYGDRAFDVPIPFVFVPDGTKRRAIRVLREAFEREVGIASEQ